MEARRILTSYYRPKPGGLCKRLFRAINALLRSGHEVHYLAVEQFPIEHANCHFHRFPWPAWCTDNIVFWMFFCSFAPLFLLLLAIRHRVTHLFAFGTTYALVMQPVRLVLRLPLSLFIRADAIMTHRLKARGRGLIAIEQTIERMAMIGSRTYAVSRALAETLRRRHPSLQQNSVRVLPNELSESRVVTRKRSAGNLIHLATVGVLEPRKNHEFAIRILSGLAPNNAHLYIYGSGPSQSSLESLVRELSVERQVSLMGWVDCSAQIWETTDLLLFPSRHEGIPNTVLEALAHGVPVLASDIPEHRELLHRRNLLPLDDLEAWCRRINLVLKDPESELARLFESASAAANRFRFDWDREMLEAIVAP